MAAKKTKKTAKQYSVVNCGYCCECDNLASAIELAKELVDDTCGDQYVVELVKLVRATAIVEDA